MKQILLLIFLLILTNGCVTKTDLEDVVSEIEYSTRMAVATERKYNKHPFYSYGKIVKIEKVPAKENNLNAKKMVCYYILPVEKRNSKVPEISDFSNCIVHIFFISYCENANSGPKIPDFKKGDTVYFFGNINKITP